MVEFRRGFHGETAFCLDKEFGFGEFLMMGSKEDGQAKRGGFEGIVESFSKGASNHCDGTKSVRIGQMTDGIENEDWG